MKACTLLSAAVVAIAAQLSPAQAVPAPPSAPPSAPLTTGDATTLQFRALPAVLDARERRQDWHQAAQQAAGLIQDPALRDQFNQRLAGLVPSVAKALIAQPQEDALVTVAVYRDPANAGKQAMVAVTFGGLGGEVGQTFYADVIAGLPKPPEAEGIPKSLTLDTEATSYLVFFLGKNQLAAGDIPHTAMGRSVLAVINRQRAPGSAAAGGTAVLTPPAPTPVSPTPPQQVTDPAHPEEGAVVADNPYVIPQGYGPVNDGYYYPSVGVPIVILPGEYPSTPAYLDLQRRRQAELEKRYQRNANVPGANHSIGAAANQSPSPSRSTSASSGNSVTATSGNSVGGTSANGLGPNSGNNVQGTSGNSVRSTSGNTVAPPAGQHPVPPVQTPPAGAPGGPPVKK